MLYLANQYSPKFIFPVDLNMQIPNRKLYYEAAQLNEVSAPEIIGFPSFYCDLQASDSTVVYPFVLSKIQLDEQGILTSRELIKTTYPDFTDHIYSTLMYADYAPALVNEKPEASTAYLIVSFFPDLNYPTEKWSDSRSDLTLLQNNQVRLIPDNQSDIAPPIIKKENGDKMIFNSFPVYVQEKISARIRVSKTGKVSTNQIKNVAKVNKPKISSFIRDMRFYPALDSTGEAVDRQGTIYFEQIDSSSDPENPEPFIRITTIWD